MEEEWRDIPGYLGHYQVSDQGRVRSLKAGSRNMKILKPAKERGYARVVLSVQGVVSRPRVHQLVALAFIGPVPDGCEVCHENGIRDDNRPINLRYGTRSDNSRDRLRHGHHNMANKTHCLRGHEFTSENTALVTLQTGSIARRCRKCDVFRYHERKRKA